MIGLPRIQGEARMPKIALITGITGQDGSYLAELLLARVIPSTASSVAPAPSTRSGSATCTGSHMSARRSSWRIEFLTGANPCGGSRTPWGGAN